jgi:hypothetical protein
LNKSSFLIRQDDHPHPDEGIVFFQLNQVVIAQTDASLAAATWHRAFIIGAAMDAYGNGKWSTGNYHHHLLPETILEYKSPLDLKAGWAIDLEEVWDLNLKQ